jgi:hypothetical protein
MARLENRHSTLLAEKRVLAVELAAIIGALVLLLAAISAIACGAHSGPDTIWDIAVEPNRANATSGSAPDNEVDFSVVAHYTSGRSAPWNGDVQWSVDSAWANLQNGHAICLQPAPLQFPLNTPTPATITARITSGGKTFTAPALLACF